MIHNFEYKQRTLTATPRGHDEKLVHFVTWVPLYGMSSEIHEMNE